ncbi:MAG: NAD(P)/FAD-dependent oxidoreductase [Candidatus Pacebacteria bacterium]|nr:NAD(P)/FAD-dependent oxidoreductase [Candidatus Paceibacterota bacterium]
MEKVRDCDLAIIGGGPAGLSAAISGASEGLRVILVDSKETLGGQASNSSSIENYPGFPEGIRGEILASHCVRQARKFRTEILCPVTAVGIRIDGDRRLVTTEDDLVIASKSVIISAGLSYRRLDAVGLGPLMGHGGVLYGAPTTDPGALGKGSVCVVGGANSAGQAALHLSKNPDLHVRLLVRKKLNDQMSQYLVERIRATANIEVIEGVEVTEVCGDSKLEHVLTYYKETSEKGRIDADHMFIFIGAQPKTFWLEGKIAMDEKRFILTGPKLTENGAIKEQWGLNRLPLAFETSMPGVFACGDVRLGSTKRIASAVGEGSVALQMCHNYLHLAGSE